MPVSWWRAVKFPKQTAEHLGSAGMRDAQRDGMSRSHRRVVLALGALFALSLPVSTVQAGPGRASLKRAKVSKKSKRINSLRDKAGIRAPKITIGDRLRTRKQKTAAIAQEASKVKDNARKTVKELTKIRDHWASKKHQLETSLMDAPTLNGQAGMYLRGVRNLANYATDSVMISRFLSYVTNPKAGGELRATFRDGFKGDAQVLALAKEVIAAHNRFDHLPAIEKLEAHILGLHKQGKLFNEKPVSLQQRSTALAGIHKQLAEAEKNLKAEQARLEAATALSDWNR